MKTKEILTDKLNNTEKRKLPSTQSDWKGRVRNTKVNYNIVTRNPNAYHAYE